MKKVKPMIAYRRSVLPSFVFMEQRIPPTQREVEGKGVHALQQPPERSLSV